MTSLSTRFLGQPRLTKPTFNGVYRPYGRISLQDSIQAGRGDARSLWRDGQGEGFHGGFEEAGFDGGVRVGQGARGGYVFGFDDDDGSHVLHVVGVAADDDDAFVAEFHELRAVLLKDGHLGLGEVGEVHAGGEFELEEEVLGRILGRGQGGEDEKGEAEKSHFAESTAKR